MKWRFLMNSVNNIDWVLFAKQKEYLLAMAGDDDRLTEEIAVLDGVINLMDALQDDFAPLNDGEEPK
jgi:hypothetical protein